MAERVAFETHPSRYRHWRLEIDPPVATLSMAVTPDAGLRDDYRLKLNSYDLAVDIELHDAVQRLRFEHPEVRVVVLTGALDKVFCAGANIQMLASSTHAHKVNFCKFTNETRSAIEEASASSGQVWIAAVNGTAAGGGYELALACDEILLVDDRSSAVSLPEVPTLAVLPGTGGLTRLVDKRHVRRDLADVFATRTEGVKGKQAVEWGLVDAVVPRSKWDVTLRERACERAATSDRPVQVPRFELLPLDDPHHVKVRIDRAHATADLIVSATDAPQPTRPEHFTPTSWLLQTARELDAAVLDLRFNEPEIGTWVLRTEGDLDAVVDADRLIAEHRDHWLVREVRLLWGRTLKRLDLSARTLVAAVEPGSCFGGTLAELLLAADRSFMLDGRWPDDDRPSPAIELTDANDGWYPMANGLSRLATRFWGREDAVATARAAKNKRLEAKPALDAGLVTFTPDDIDWGDELRLALEERASFSPDALTGMEASLRFVGPETMETKIFGRLTAWQNWIFQRPNAVGPAGALQRYGTGSRPEFDRGRV